MPRMDGPGLVREVREIHPDMKVIFISGYTEDAFRQRLDSDSDIHFLPKPFSLKQLASQGEGCDRRGASDAVDAAACLARLEVALAPVNKSSCCVQNKLGTSSACLRSRRSTGCGIRERDLCRPALRLLDKETMDKQRALDAALGQIERAFGKGSIMKLGSREAAAEVEVISTGSLGLDIALGIGGLPRGRVVEIYGPESSGKTTLALHVIAEAQKSGGTCAFIDAEHALDPAYARKLGVDIDDLLISQPDAGEQALEIADTLVRSGAIDVLVIDSVAALVPRAELEGEMGDSHMGLHARLMSQALRKLTGSISRSRAMVIFINQIRLKIGVMFGNPETTTGGNALKFYASVRLDIRRIGAIKDRDQVDRQPDPRQGRQEQDGAAVQGRRFRHHVRRGRLQARRTDRSRRAGRGRREIRLLVLL